MKIISNAVENQMNVVLNLAFSFDFLFISAEPMVIRMTEKVIRNI